MNVVIIGVNCGIGFVLVKQYLVGGYLVYVFCCNSLDVLNVIGVEVISGVDVGVLDSLL